MPRESIDAARRLLEDARAKGVRVVLPVDFALDDGSVATLGRLQATGVAVYVGGSEGRAALDRYGRLSDVSHEFTAEGTILQCPTDRPLPYVEARAEQPRTA